MEGKSRMRFRCTVTIFFGLSAVVSSQTLPQAIQMQLPACAQQCLWNSIATHFQSVCPNLADLSCLCSKTGTNGYSLGDLINQCTYQSGICTAAQQLHGSSSYNICPQDLITTTTTETTGTTTTAASPSQTTGAGETAPVSTDSASTSQTGLWAGASGVPGSSTSASPSSTSGSSAGSGSSGHKKLSTAQISAIAAGSVVAGILGVVLVLFFFVRGRKTKGDEEKRDSDVIREIRPTSPESRDGSETSAEAEPPVTTTSQRVRDMIASVRSKPPGPSPYGQGKSEWQRPRRKNPPIPYFGPNFSLSLAAIRRKAVPKRVASLDEKRPTTADSDESFVGDIDEITPVPRSKATTPDPYHEPRSPTARFFVPHLITSIYENEGKQTNNESQTVRFSVEHLTIPNISSASLADQKTPTLSLIIPPIARGKPPVPYRGSTGSSMESLRPKEMMNSAGYSDSAYDIPNSALSSNYGSRQTSPHNILKPNSPFAAIPQHPRFSTPPPTRPLPPVPTKSVDAVGADPVPGESDIETGSEGDCSPTPISPMKHPIKSLSSLSNNRLDSDSQSPISDLRYPEIPRRQNTSQKVFRQVTNQTSQGSVVGLAAMYDVGAPSEGTITRPSSALTSYTPLPNRSPSLGNQAPTTVLGSPPNAARVSVIRPPSSRYSASPASATPSYTHPLPPLPSAYFPMPNNLSESPGPLSPPLQLVWDAASSQHDSQDLGLLTVESTARRLRSGNGSSSSLSSLPELPEPDDDNRLIPSMRNGKTGHHQRSASTNDLSIQNHLSKSPNLSERSSQHRWSSRCTTPVIQLAPPADDGELLEGLMIIEDSSRPSTSASNYHTGPSRRVSTSSFNTTSGMTVLGENISFMVASPSASVATLRGAQKSPFTSPMGSPMSSPRQGPVTFQTPPRQASPYSTPPHSRQGSGNSKHNPSSSVSKITPLTPPDSVLGNGGRDKRNSGLWGTRRSMSGEALRNGASEGYYDLDIL